jgi:hypothetical protein
LLTKAGAGLWSGPGIRPGSYTKSSTVFTHKYLNLVENQRFRRSGSPAEASGVGSGASVNINAAPKFKLHDFLASFLANIPRCFKPANQKGSAGLYGVPEAAWPNVD